MRFLSNILLAGFLLTALSACIKPEVIPPPTNNVDLNCQFSGFINGTETEYMQNIKGYNCYSSNLVYGNPSPNLSNVLYTAEISSFQYPQKVKLTFGPQQWDAGVAITPTLDMFNDFHLVNSGDVLPLKDIEDMPNSSPGVQVEYWDVNGDKWETSTDDQPGFATITTLKQASDNTGDYTIFECVFSVTVFREDPNQFLLSLTLNNCKFKGWFKR